MTASPTLQERRSECTVCPEWVVRCVHFDGRMLIMVDEKAAEAHCDSPDVLSYSVHLASGFGSCSACSALVAECISVCDVFLTLPDAQDEFRRREAALLGREA